MNRNLDDDRSRLLPKVMNFDHYKAFHILRDRWRLRNLVPIYFGGDARLIITNCKFILPSKVL